MKGANTITSERPQLPPRPWGASQIVAGEPPFKSRRQSLPRMKNAMAFPSGDQNGKKASSVSRRGVASSLSRERTQMEFFPSCWATKASRLPSGESAGGPLRYKVSNCVPCGGKMFVRRTRCLRGEDQNIAASATAANKTTASNANPRLRRMALAGAMAGVPTCEPDFAIQASCSFTSCAV